MISLFNSQPSYNRLLLLCSIVFIIVSSLINLIPDKSSPDNTAVSTQTYYTTEGYIVGKRLDRILLTDSPLSIRERIKGLITSDYGQSLVLVSIHPHSNNKKMFDRLKINQKVRVYGDRLKESNPPQTSAYHIEVIQDE